MRFTERSPLLLGLVAVALIAVVTLLALTVQRADFGPGYELTVQFADASGLRAGDSVLVGGVRVGQVVALDIVGDHVDARLQVEGTELSADARAEIVLRTLVGRRAVQLDTGGDFSELLSDGDVIPVGRTSVLIDVPEFGDVSEELLDEVDAQALDTFFRSLTAVTRDQHDELALLVEGGTRLTGVINDQEEQLRRLLRALRAVSATLADSDDDLVAVIDDVGLVLDRVAERRDDVRRLLRETNATSGTAADLVADTRGELDRILTELHADVEILSRHQLHLAEALAYAPEGVGGFADITYAGQQPVPYGKVFVTSLGPAGVDVLVGCGGLIDQQLDLLLGPDPRPCEEQTNRKFPRRDPGEQPTPADGLASSAPSTTQRHSLDVLARRMLPPRTAQGPTS